MTGSVQFARDKRAIVQWNFIYILETWNPLSHCKQDSCNCEQDNMSFHSVFPSTDRQETVTNPTFFCFVLFFVSVDSLFFFSTRSSNIRSVASGHFCGPLSPTFPRWSGRAGGTVCWRRFALLNIPSACSGESPGFLRCSGRNVMPIVKRAHLPRSVDSTRTRASRALTAASQTNATRVFTCAGIHQLKKKKKKKGFHFRITQITQREDGDTFPFFSFFFLHFVACGALQQPPTQSWQNQIWGKRQNIRRKRP